MVRVGWYQVVLTYQVPEKQNVKTSGLSFNPYKDVWAANVINSTKLHHIWLYLEMERGWWLYKYLHMIIINTHDLFQGNITFYIIVSYRLLRIFLWVKTSPCIVWYLYLYLHTEYCKIRWECIINILVRILDPFNKRIILVLRYSINFHSISLPSEIHVLVSTTYKFRW